VGLADGGPATAAEVGATLAAGSADAAVGAAGGCPVRLRLEEAFFLAYVLRCLEVVTPEARARAQSGGSGLHLHAAAGGWRVAAIGAGRDPSVVLSHCSIDGLKPHAPSAERGRACSEHTSS